MFRTPPDEIPREMSLRLTAIRETFEEAGILILKKNGRLIKSEELPNLEEFKNLLCNETVTDFRNIG